MASAKGEDKRQATLASATRVIAARGSSEAGLAVFAAHVPTLARRYRRDASG